MIYDTASISTMHALVAAREAAVASVRSRGLAGRGDIPGLRVYCSEQAHSSIDKAVIAIGLGHESLRRIPVDSAYRMRPDALRDAIAEDRAAGLLPIAVVATVGTTSTTSVDPVADVAAICEREGLWLHVDAAYAGVAAMLPSHAHILGGADRADSLVVNPHKWLFTPVDISVLYCRRMDVLRAAFALTPEISCARRRPDRRRAQQLDGHRRPARPPVPIAEAVDDPSVVRRADRFASGCPNTSASRSCLPRGWTRTRISSGWRPFRSAWCASDGIPPVERSRPRSSTPPTNGCSIS